MNAHEVELPRLLRKVSLRLGFLVLALSWTSFWASSLASAQDGNPPAKDDRAPAEPLPIFEVATIKPAAPSSDGHTHINYPRGGSFSASNITLLALMEWAYDTPQRQILEGPAWLASARFDLQAKTDAAADTQLRSLASDREHEIKRRMVQALLADRYHLKLHQEARVLPAYDLILAKGGSKLQPSQSGAKNIGTGRNHFNGQGLTTDLIAEQLSQFAGRVVVDKTQLTGRYDLKLQWTPDDETPTENSPPSLFTAIQEQLGLKLEPAKEPVPVLIVDHIELPSAN